MKIKVADLEPNPFRKIKEYPIDRAKVEALKTSIREKTFWDNILVRPHNGKYQIAYGHHRHICLVELGIKEIDVPVRDLSDALMLQIMAEENLNWSTAPAIMVQTILTAKEYLDAELQKYEEWNNAQDFLRVLFSSNRQFQEVKKTGVGEGTLAKFLGGNWTLHKIREALKIIKDKTLDKKAVKVIPTMEQARVFRASVKQHDIPKPTQQVIAKTIAKEGVGRRDIPNLVAEHSKYPIPKLSKKKILKPRKFPNIIEYVFKCENDTNSLNHRLKALIPEINEIVNNGRLLGRLTPGLIRLRKTIKKYCEEYERIQSGKGKDKAKKVASVQILD